MTKEQAEKILFHYNIRGGNLSCYECKHQIHKLHKIEDCNNCPLYSQSFSLD